MIYGLITILLFFVPLLRRYFQIIIFILCAILWVSLLETVFFKNFTWFKEMKLMSRNTNGNCFYFIENDNMMHWELIHKFDETANVYYNLGKKPFFVSDLYNPNINSTLFKPGWLIVNMVYPEPSPKFQSTLNLLKKTNTFEKCLLYNYIEAFYISDSVTMQQLMTSVE